MFRVKSAVVNIYRHHQTEHAHFFMESFSYSPWNPPKAPPVVILFLALHFIPLHSGFGVCSTSWVSSSLSSSSSHRGIFSNNKRGKRKKRKVAIVFWYVTLHLSQGSPPPQKYWKEESDGSAGLLGKRGLKKKDERILLRFPLSLKVGVTLILFFIWAYP